MVPLVNRDIRRCELEVAVEAPELKLPHSKVDVRQSCVGFTFKVIRVHSCDSDL